MKIYIVSNVDHSIPCISEKVAIREVNKIIKEEYPRDLYTWKKYKTKSGFYYRGHFKNNSNDYTDELIHIFVEELRE